MTDPSSAAHTAADDELIVMAYLAFLDEQMERHPELIQPLDALLARAGELVGHVEVDLGEDPGGETFLP